MSFAWACANPNKARRKFLGISFRCRRTNSAGKTVCPADARDAKPPLPGRRVARFQGPDRDSKVAGRGPQRHEGHRRRLVQTRRRHAVSQGLGGHSRHENVGPEGGEGERERKTATPPLILNIGSLKKDGPLDAMLLDFHRVSLAFLLNCLFLVFSYFIGFIIKLNKLIWEFSVVVMREKE